jgi:hypothetical protein
VRRQVLLKGTLLLAVSLGLLCGPATAPAADPPPFLTLGGFDPRSELPAELDPAFPTGARLGPARPTAALRACSRVRPVCVHSQTGSRPWAALADLEQAYDTTVLGLRAPPPLPDSGGGSPDLDLYLVADASRLAVAADLGTGRGDARGAYCIANARDFDVGTALRCVVEASSFRLDAAETPALRRGLSSYLAWLALGPDEQSLAAVDVAQSQPERAPLTRDINPRSEAAALFFAHVEEAYGSGRPAQAALSLFAQSRRDDASTGLFWNNEPDLLDVLRYAANDDPGRFADLAIDFAIARLFLGDRDDGSHYPGAAWLGTFGRVRFDWTIEWSSLPRNLASPRALEPLGSSYVWLDTRSVPKDAQLGASFSWEAPVRFRFSIVAIDAQGRELQRFDVPFFSSGTRVERTVRVPPAAAGLAFVSMNLGGVSSDFPFDPDHEPWEPHAFELYLARL